MPTYSDLQRAQLRQVMGYTKLFASSNAIFENVLDTIQSTLDDGSTFNLTITLLNNVLQIDQLRLQNQNLGLATEATDQAKFDAARNDQFLKSVGRTNIKQLSIILSMQPAEDYYGRPTIDRSGNIFPAPAEY